MSRYTPLPSDQSFSSPPATPSRRTSFHSIRSFRLNTNRNRAGAIPNPDEMDAAFDGPDGEGEDETENHGLLGRDRGNFTNDGARMPGDYDFERDYTLPPSSPPPFQPYSSHNPAPGNTNGIIPTSPTYHPPQRRHFLGGLLPSSFLPRHQANGSPASRIIGAGSSGVFGNLAARPDTSAQEGGRDEGDYVPEDEQKEGPPSYQAALRDAVPPYWDTTVVLPSSSSPFGPLSSSMSGDEILIDGMPGGNFFGFFWNLIVSFSFQFVGFLLTYVLHTTHAAKYGSRVGLGMTLISVGLNLRSKAEDLINTGRFPSDPSDPDPPAGTPVIDEDAMAENAIEAIWGPGGPWPYPVHEPNDPNGPITILHNTQEAENWAHQHNMTLAGFMGLPNAEDVGRANEYFSFLMMSIGWFIVLTSLGGWWRVKRFERGLKAAQRESEAAQEAANNNRNNPDGVTADGEGEDNLEVVSTARTRDTEPSPNEIRYYTQPISQAWQGVRVLQRGFLGMNGRPLGRRNGHAPLSQDDGGEGDEHELLDAQGFGLGPMASDTPQGQGVAGEYPGRDRRGGGLWGV
ncbi:hypothetical protein I302_104697 [Kwoniella bestiolae CBS 10118]|uniref:Metal homeostatis protein bsd2 n=1 Tax=Kwoniella bestiolae CBS 10118 TaxID=1296100 RepID=A0A1B9FS12_9TREE|nr:metal homeostatis protein bsd2 [Kwoniella bestiolae CBS 10118]OCF21554.1 metal homeostatis protein bsd2 [Kwoniella bestiolae CBS 10118]